MIKVAVIGCGYWGLNIIRTLHETPNCILRTCCDIDEHKLKLVLTKYPDVMITKYVDEIVNDNSVDAVFIATPTSLHYPIAKETLLAGKSTFVEKPFTSSVKQGQELIEIAEKTNTTLMVGHIFEYVPAVNEIKKILSRGEIGEIYYISSTRVNLGIHRKDVSVIWDLASHDLSILFHWLEEEPVSLSCVGKGSIIEYIPDIAFLTLTFPSGVLANIQVSWLAPSKFRNITIVGSKKMIIYDDANPIEKIKIFDKAISVLNHASFGEFQLSYRTGDMTAPVLPNVEPLREEINHFIDCVEHKKTPRTTGISGIRVVKYLELAEKSLQQGGKIIKVN